MSRVRIAGVEMQSDDPAALAACWATVLNRPLRDDTGVPAIALDAGTTRFVRAVDGRGDGVSGIVLAVADRDRLFDNARARGLAIDGNRVLIGGVWFGGLG